MLLPPAALGVMFDFDVKEGTVMTDIHLLDSREQDLLRAKTVTGQNL